MSADTKVKVFVLGATGRTGESIVNALLESSSFHVTISVRSTSKPVVQDFQSRGATLCLLDLTSAESKAIEDAVTGQDVVISAIDYQSLQLQRKLIDACKKVGVGRFVPCDFGTACVRGVRPMHDEKLGIHDYIKEVGLPYTFIDVGLWYSLIHPILKPEKAFMPFLVEISKYVFESGTTPGAFIDLPDIGPFVAKIVSDPRTLNRYVFAYGEHLTQTQIFEISREASGEEIPANHKSAADLRQIIAEAKASGGHSASLLEYYYSIWVRGDDTVENAKKPEYGSALDARELYPDVKTKSFREYAVEYYSKP